MRDREILEALLAGKKLEKKRQEGSGTYIFLDEDDLVDDKGNPANIYRINQSDIFVILEEKEEA